MKRSLLRHPAVIGGVVLGLMAVTVLNLETFASGRWFGPDADEASASHLVPPADLEEVVRGAVAARNRDTGLALAGSLGGPTITRDPFTGSVAAPAPTTAKPASRAASRPKPAPLQCTAVMLGGRRPLALIDGESHGPGDSLGPWTIDAIDTEGVTLVRKDGRQKRLAVGPARDDEARYHVITEAEVGNDRGKTRLEDSSAERTHR